MTVAQKLFRFIFLFLALMLAIGAGVYAWGYSQFHQPGPLKSAKTIIVPRGAGVEQIASLLKNSGIIVSPLVFTVGVRLQRISKGLQAGEFQFSAKMSARDVAAHLRSGKTVVRRVTIPEGLSTAEILTLLHRTEGLAGGVLKLMPIAEGTLLPETYHFSYGDSRESIIRRMRKNMSTTLNRLWPGREDGLPIQSQQEALILASIVEKETALAPERAKIAGVFINRLRKKMPLQSDPTVLYAVTQGQRTLDRPLSRADLAFESPYNTYLHKKLPPGPICNPGEASLRAVLNPEKTDALYFVADGKGGHAFARTLKEHNRNVARWRKWQRNQKIKN
ncbi:MAG: endolytic transglycosylase MltG [Rhodospirillaceae bacterium]